MVGAECLASYAVTLLLGLGIALNIYEHIIPLLYGYLLFRFATLIAMLIKGWLARGICVRLALGWSWIDACAQAGLGIYVVILLVARY